MYMLRRMKRMFLFFALKVGEEEEKNLSNQVQSFLDWRSVLALNKYPVDLQAYLKGKTWLNYLDQLRFCSCCGKELVVNEGGMIVQCCGVESKPFISPVIITTVINNDQCLLVRGAKYPTGVYSCIAGFLEAGESLQQCVAREVLEETKIQINHKSIQYISSQSWSTPEGVNLMMGFTAETNQKEFTIDTEELSGAKWFTKAEIKECIDSHTKERKGKTSHGYNIPPPFAIAHQLLKRWISLQ